jgi:hypothetical protein
VSETEHESAGDIVQDESLKMPAVAVEVEGIVRTQALPGRGTAEVVPEVLIDGAAARRILSADPRRRKAQILSSDYHFYFGSGQQRATATTGGLWLDAVPLVWESTNELWAMAAESGHNSTLAVVSERWAE